jgi:hypothetical protein
MRQRERLGVFFVKLQRDRHGTRHLRHFQGVSEAVSEVIGKTGGKHLRFAFQSAECSGVDNAVAVALEIASISVGRFRKSAAAQTLWTKAKSAQHSLADELSGQLARQLVHRPADCGGLIRPSQRLKNLLRFLWVRCQV